MTTSTNHQRRRGRHARGFADQLAALFESDPWDTPLVDGDQEPAGPALSPEEAFYMARAAALAEAASKDRGQPRTAWWRHNWRKTFRSPTQADRAVASEVGVNPGTFYCYLNVVAGYSNADGTEPIYALRETIAAEMGCSIRTVDRCRQVAIRRGYHTTGYQARWIDETKSSDAPWAASSAAVVLTMPDKASLPLSPQSLKVRNRIRQRHEARRQRALQARQQRDREARSHVETLIAAAIGPEATPRSTPPGVAAALRQARARLDTS